MTLPRNSDPLKIAKTDSQLWFVLTGSRVNVLIDGDHTLPLFRRNAEIMRVLEESFLAPEKLLT